MESLDARLRTQITLHGWMSSKLASKREGRKASQVIREEENWDFF